MSSETCICIIIEKDDWIDNEFNTDDQFEKF